MNLMYPRFLKVVLVLPFFIFISNKAFSDDVNLFGDAGVKCDPTEELDYIANLDYYYKSLIDPGQTIKLTCAMGYGVFEKNSSGAETGIINSSYTVTCQDDGTFTGYQNNPCQSACSVSDALNYKNHVKSNPVATYNGQITPISQSKLVRDGTVLTISCLPYYVLQDDIKNTTYKYTCTNYQRQAVQKCTVTPPTFNIIKPTSISTGATNFNCNLNVLQSIADSALTGVDGVPQGTTPKALIDPGAKAFIACKPGYSSIAAGKLVEKFTAVCDPKGSGKFFFYDDTETVEENRYKSLLTCTKRCTAEELISASSAVDANNSYIAGGTATVSFPYGNKNAPDNLYTHIDFGDTVKGVCPSGYEIRLYYQNNYNTTCIPGGFSDTNRCEPILAPCDNGDIITGGSVVYSPNGKAIVVGGNSVSGTTKVGRRLDVECQGGSKYFINSGGQTGKPMCIFNTKTNQSYWDNPNFQCYNGCIEANNNRWKIGQGLVNKFDFWTKDVMQYCSHTDWIFGNLWSGYIEYDPYCDFYGGMQSFFQDSNLRAVFWYRTFNPNTPVRPENISGSGDFPVAKIIIQIYDISYCPERQVDLKKTTVEFQGLISPAVHGDHNGVNASMHRIDISTYNGVHACQQEINRRFGASQVSNITMNSDPECGDFYNALQIPPINSVNADDCAGEPPGHMNWGSNDAFKDMRAGISITFDATVRCNMNGVLTPPLDLF